MARIALYERRRPYARFPERRGIDDRAFDPLRGQRVRIYSGEHRAYWGPDWCGYYDAPGAAVYDFAEAYYHVAHCGPEKMIEFELVGLPKIAPPDPDPYRAERCGCHDPNCSAWHVWPVAAVQGVRFTEAQARAVADLLKRFEG